MMYRNRKLFILIMAGLLLSLIMLAGCKKNDDHRLSGKRVGVYVETYTGNRQNISSIIVNRINRKIRDVTAVSVVSGELSVDDINSLKQLQQEMNLDYLVLVRILSLEVGEDSPTVDISREKIGLTRQYQCNVTLNFRVVELSKATVVLIGETQGSAFSSDYYGLSRNGKISIGQGSKNEETRLIEAALIDAVDRSNLVK
jgi:hypothetical protein